MSNSTSLGIRRRVVRSRVLAALVLLLLGIGPASVAAQEAGVSASVVVVDEGAISADGDLSEWADLPIIVSVDGTQPSDDPGTRGRLRWQVAADSTTVYLAATVTDDVIFVGDDPSRYWADDSIEFFLNLSGDLTAVDYTAGIAQMRVTPLGLGEADQIPLTLSGTNFEQFPVSGVTFSTEDGWGTELAIDVSEFAAPTVGDRFGIQIHANGSSGEGRDLKVIWSARDQNDTSFEDPSVFGQGVFVSSDGAVGDADPVSEEGTAEDGLVEDAVVAAPSPEISELESTGPEIITGEEQQRSLLYAAVASSITVLFAGLWFERKRKKDEAKHQADRSSTSEPAEHV